MKVKNRSVLLFVAIVILLLSPACTITSNQSPSIISPTLVHESTDNPETTNTPEFTRTPKPLWKISSSVDEMTGKTSYYAISPKISPTKPMDSPYDDVMAWFGVGCSESFEWAFIGFSTAPNLENTEIEDGYDRISTRVKWDDSIEEITLIHYWGNKFIRFLFDALIIENLESHDTLLLELEWYGEGNVYFKFPLAGGAEGIKTILTNCTP